MDLNAVRFLLKVAETHSFTQAAGILGITQSGISRAIDRLEKQLGVRLVNRNTRSVSLTPEGQLFYERCIPLLAGLEETEQLLIDKRCIPTGICKVTMPTAFGSIVVLPLLGKLTQQYASLSFDMQLTDRVVDIIDEGFEATVRIGEIKDLGMIARPLKPLRWITVASADYLTQYGTPQTPNELDTHNCLTVKNPYTNRPVAWQFLQNGQLVDILVTGNLIFNSGDSLINGAIQGFGICQIMDFVAKEAINDGRLIPILEDFAGRTRPLSLVYLPSRQNSPRIKVLYETLKEHWGSDVGNFVK